MCTCDRDCGAYKGFIEMRGAPNFFRAETICQVDWDQCVGCKQCMRQCQFGAQFYSSALGKVYFDATWSSMNGWMLSQVSGVCLGL
jgi:Fe-S-cluster-containing dehydrogenase component